MKNSASFYDLIWDWDGRADGRMVTFKNKKSH